MDLKKPRMADVSGCASFSSSETEFDSIGIPRERPTWRRAVACGTIHMNREAFYALQNNPSQKENAIALAKVAGMMGAKNTSLLVPTRHTPPLDKTLIHFEVNGLSCSIKIYAQVIAFSKTDLEIEALSGVHAALLTLWDLVKDTDPNLSLTQVQLLLKTGGKNGTWVNSEGIPAWIQEQLPNPKFLNEKSAAILVMSDRASKGEYKDESGAELKTLLTGAGATIKNYKVIPDDGDKIEAELLNICHHDKPDLLITSGGTGPGPRDVTPDVLVKISDRMLDGLGDVLRTESLYYTDTAWLSRATACMIGTTLVIALPGSPKAVRECWDILSPFLGTALDKIKKQGFETSK